MDWDRLLEPVAGLDTHLGRELTRFQKLFYDCRPGLQAMFSLATKLGRTQYLLYAIKYVQNSDPELVELFPEVTDREWQQPIAESALPLHLWQMRQELIDHNAPKRVTATLSSVNGCSGLVAISLERAHGFSAWPVNDACIPRLEETHEISLAGLPVPINRLMYGIWSTRPELQERYRLDSLSSQADFAIWFIATAPRLYRLSQLHLTAHSLRFLNRPRLPAAARPRLSRFMELAACAIQHPAFPVETSSPEARVAFRSWFARHAVAAFDCSPSLLLPLLASADAPLVAGRLSRPFFSRRPAPARSWRSSQQPERDRQPGVTVVGPVCGAYGVSQLTRGVCLAVQVAGYPVEAFDLTPSFGGFVRENDDVHRAEVQSLLTESPTRTTNLFAATADYVLGVDPQLAKALDLRRTTNVLYPYWELTGYPPPHAEIAGMFDEVWAPSLFIKESLENAIQREVIHMPPPVSVHLDRHYARRDYRLPEDRFLFFFSFDAYSSLSRKNPAAVVRAFQRAFPGGVESVALVLRIVNFRKTLSKVNSELDEELERLIAADERIVIADQKLTRSEFLGLMSNCDCYVSLHRSEGFGYGMAEAMLFDKPVIATNYSGNVDFARPDTALMVDYELVPVKPGEFLFGDGQLWAEADVDHAASLMRSVLHEDAAQQRMRQKARQWVAATYGTEVCGRRYRSRLEQLERR